MSEILHLSIDDLPTDYTWGDDLEKALGPHPYGASSGGGWIMRAERLVRRVNRLEKALKKIKKTSKDSRIATIVDIALVQERPYINPR